MFDFVLVVPPSPFLLDQKRNPPLGILYLAAVLEREQVDFVISDLRGIREKEWYDHIPRAKCYGISATSVEYPAAQRIAIHLRKRGKPIVLGGVHASVSMDINGFSSVVRGEAEGIISQVVRDAPNTLAPVYMGPVPVLDDLPIPARHLLPLESWANTKLVKGHLSTSIIGSRGCPYQCSFCSEPLMFHRQVRFRSPKLIAAEIAYLKTNYGITGFRFHDDLLTLKTSWFKELCSLLKPLRIAFRCNARVDTLSPGKCHMLKQAGCVDIGLGVESVYQPCLDLIQKNQTVEQCEQAISMLRDAGIKSRVFLIVGLPGDIGDISGRIISWLERVRPDGCDVNTLVPLPGSDLFTHPEKYGIIFRPNFSLANLAMLRGLDEADDDFVIEYVGMSNNDLKGHRRAILEYTREKGLNVDD